MCLNDVGRGQEVYITCIEDESLRTQLVRFGISEGSCIRCLERIPLGPCMIRHNRQEIAIGRDAAEKVRVRRERAR
jgi:Fe2+ transport system protein FeoA